MALAPPLNSALPYSWKVPGVFIELDLTGSGGALGSVDKRLLLLAYTGTGTQAVDTPVRVSGQSAANTYYQRGSDMARLFAAVQSQNGGGVIDIYCCGITAPTSGTASTHLITFATTATASGAVTVTICGYSTTVGIASGDTPTVVATNVSAAINLLLDLPVTASPSTGTVTLTYRHKGLVGNDLPVMVTFSGSSGVTASPGTIVYATNATGAGTATVTIGGTTISAAIANSDTPTIIGTSVAAAINGGAYPVTALAATGTVTLYYAPGRVVHRISAAIVTTTGTTATPAVGTAGAGTPVLTTALANIAKLNAFKCWSSSFNEVTSLGTMSTHIESYADGRAQKGQALFIASTDALATAGAVPVGTTPALTASPRYSLGWCPDAPQQAYELGGRYAAAVCVSDFAPQNFDGVQIRSKTDSVPLLLPHFVSRAGIEDQNSAMLSYYMTPLAVDEQSSTLVILRAVTTCNLPDVRLQEVSVLQTMDFYRYDLNLFMRSRFKQKNFKASGVPKTTNTVTTANFKDAIFERLLLWDNNDLFDGADAVKSQILVGQNATVPTRIDCFVPCKPPLPIHQIGIVAGLV